MVNWKVYLKLRSYKTTKNGAYISNIHGKQSFMQRMQLKLNENENGATGVSSCLSCFNRNFVRKKITTQESHCQK